MELFEAIRREYQFGVGTVKGVARKFGVHRRMVREALADAVPKERRPVQRARPKLDPAVPFIDMILENDLKEPRKQRHTAHRIYNRLLIEKPDIKVAEATVRAYVRDRKLKIGQRGLFAPGEWEQLERIRQVQAVHEIVARIGYEGTTRQIRFCTAAPRAGGGTLA